MIPSIPRLSDYDVDALNGFLPPEPPLELLPDPYYGPWETIIRNLQPLILSKRLRGIVDRLPLLSTEYLHTEPEWRRAYMVLAFISHAYIWGGDTPLDVVPPSVSIPFLETCSHLELPPVATFAATVLWNWRPLFPSEPIDSLDNLSTLATFTGSLDESWFFMVSVAIEARGAPIVPMMVDAIAAARYGDAETVVECLRSFAERLDELGGLLTRMYESCDPHVFYHRIRPFLAGSKNMADAGLPNGVMFDDGTGNSPYVQYSGGSNAQSSIIQFFDLVLGIEHRPTGQKPPSADTTSASESEASHGPPPMTTHNFIKDMRTYMPGPHRRFLEHIASVANIRDFVESRRPNRALCTAYDACLAMLRAFRDKHIQMVSRYIIVKSRESRSHSRSISPRNAAPQRLNLATSASKASKASAAAAAIDSADDSSSSGPSLAYYHHRPSTMERRKLRGTGGTALIPFLKQARDETGEPAIDAWARRLLNNGPAYEYSGLRTGSAAAASAAASAGTAGEGARLTKMGEHPSGEMQIVGLAGTWSVDDSEGGICHW